MSNVMNIKAYVERNVTRDLMEVLENAWQIPVAGPLNTDLYSFEAFKVALDLDMISDNNQNYVLTHRGRTHLQSLLDLAYSTVSNNGNVFHYSSYWRTWSRVLFHMPLDTRQDHPHHVLKRDLGIDSTWIEIDLTAINPSVRTQWESHVQHGNIRAHHTDLRADDLITGTLPGSVVHEMQQWLKPDVVQKLIHADYLPHLDFKRLRQNSNGGAAFKNCFRQSLSHEEYLHEVRISGGGPGILLTDVFEDYKQYLKDTEKERALLWTDHGMIV